MERKKLRIRVERKYSPQAQESFSFMGVGDVLVKCGSRWVKCPIEVVVGAKYTNYKEL